MRFTKSLLSLACGLFLLLAAFVFPQSIFSAAYGVGPYGGKNYGYGVEPNTPAGPTPCGDKQPGSNPIWLYSAVPNGANSVTLYFTEGQDPFDHYALEFGSSPNKYQYGSDNIGGKGTRSYQVKFLSSNTTYYFRVRAGNGCATGAWSNEISATTKRKVVLNNLEIVSSELVPVGKNELPSKKPMEDGKASKESGYEVKVKVVDTKKKPVVGAKVSLYSSPREAFTDQNGVAGFTGVESGEHRVIIAYNNYQGEETINLTGDTREFSLTIEIKKTNPLLAPEVVAVIVLLVFTVGILAFLLIKSRKR